MKYDGTVVVVSHDREFLDGMVEKVYEFRDGGVKEYLGGIYYFLEKSARSSRCGRSSGATRRRKALPRRAPQGTIPEQEALRDGVRPGRRPPRNPAR